jgi:hypothetical protein
LFGIIERYTLSPNVTKTALLVKLFLFFLQRKRWKKSDGKDNVALPAEALFFPLSLIAGHDRKDVVV